MFPGVLITPFHESADRGRGGVELGDLVPFDDVPEAGRIGKIRRALIHEGRHAIGQQPIHDITVPGDPADVRRAPEDLIAIGNEIEHVFGSEIRIDHVPASSVHDPLGLAGGAGGVEQEEHVLAVHGFAGTFFACASDDFVPPVIATVGPLNVIVTPLEHDH